ncbi:hypothetical protein T492DRAFT_884665, partial [Pavlovales sp. CCMP2436]
ASAIETARLLTIEAASNETARLLAAGASAAVAAAAVLEYNEVQTFRREKASIVIQAASRGRATRKFVTAVKRERETAAFSAKLRAAELRKAKASMAAKRVSAVKLQAGKELELNQILETKRLAREAAFKEASATKLQEAFATKLQVKLIR